MRQKPGMFQSYGQYFRWLIVWGAVGAVIISILIGFFGG